MGKTINPKKLMFWGLWLTAGLASIVAKLGFDSIELTLIGDIIFTLALVSLMFYLSIEEKKTKHVKERK